MLIKYRICQLPVKISAICRGEGLKLLSYSRHREAIRALGLGEHCQENEGFLYRNTIFYNDACSLQCQRFTLAHELGHHLLHNRSRLYKRDPAAQGDPVEAAANILASRILAPSFVLWELGLTDRPEEIARLCDISLSSARRRARRLESLRQGGSYRPTPQERALREQFDAYICRHRH